MSSRLEFHPLSELFPLLEGAEFDALAADIKAHGLREPIVVYDDGKILDGRNRYRACLKARVYPLTRKYNVIVDGPVVPFVLSLNLHRRHLDESQRAMVAARLATLERGNPQLRKSAELEGITQAAAAELLNVGIRSIQNAREVLDKGTGELVDAVQRGDVAVSTAADLADLPKEQQREIVARGEKEILAAAKQIRSAVREAKREEVRAKLNDVDAMAAKEAQGVYDVVVIDPPWPMEKIERDEFPTQVGFDYPTMNEEELRALSLPCADTCHVWVWTTHKHLPMAMRLLEAWGLSYVCTFVWHKPGGFQPFGLPQYNCEFALYARRGGPVFLDTKAFPVCFDAPRGGHSEKPEEFYAMVRRVTGGRRLDMFNRRMIEGFDGWGKEAVA